MLPYILPPRSHDPNHRSRVGRRLLGAAIVALALLALVGGCTAAVRSIGHEDVTFRLSEKERVQDSDGKGSKYLLFTEDPATGEPAETFKVTDSWVFWNFRASDRYGAMEPGQVYRCEVYGWRVGFLSAYRNAIDCDELDDTPAPPRKATE